MDEEILELVYSTSKDDEKDIPLGMYIDADGNLCIKEWLM